MYKGYPSQEKDNGLGSQFVTVSPVREKQWALDIRSALFVESIANKVVAAGSTTTQVACVAHGARQGDLIRFTSGSQSGKEISIAKIIDVNTFQVGETMSAAPAAADAFTLERFRHPLVDPVSGGVLTSTGPTQFTRNGANQVVTQDTVTPANNRSLPVQLIDQTGPITQGQKTMANSLPVAIASDQGAVPASQSGTWSTRLQDGAGSAVNKGQAVMAASLPVAIASDQGALPMKAPVNSAGSGTSSTVTTVKTENAPANAVGFILQCLDTSTANIRWAIGRAAAAGVGQQLQPGRDTGFIPCGANVSIISEAGASQGYDIQWVTQ